MIDNCHKCHARIGAHVGTPVTNPPVHYHVEGPFPCVIDTCGVVCPSCHAVNNVAINSARPMEHLSWSVPSESMTEGRDYVYADARPQKIDGSKPVIVCWAWTPMPDDEQITSNLVAAIMTDKELGRVDLQSVLVMEMDNIIPKVMKVLPEFDSCILLKSHVVRRPKGPYASLRAERSIRHTWSNCIIGVRHYWPSPSLLPADYIPLGDDEYLAKAWGRYSRREVMNRIAA